MEHKVLHLRGEMPIIIKILVENVEGNNEINTLENYMKLKNILHML